MFKLCLSVFIPYFLRYRCYFFYSVKIDTTNTGAMDHQIAKYRRIGFY